MDRGLYTFSGRNGGLYMWPLGSVSHLDNWCFSLRASLYGLRSGYLTVSQHVAEILKRFIANFLSCDVCR